MLFAVFGWIALAGALCWPFLLYRIISKASKDRSAGVECFLLALFSLTRCKLAEVETIDEIPCPGVGIDTVIIPGWDNQPDD